MKSRLTFRNASPLALLIALLPALTSWGQDKPHKHELDAASAAVINKASAYLKGAKSVRFDVKVEAISEFNGKKQEIVTQHEVIYAGPNRFTMGLKGQTEMGGSIISDGKEMVTHVPSLKKYTVVPAVGSMDDLIKMKMVGELSRGGIKFYGPLLHSKPVETYQNTVHGGKVAGVEKVDGVECHRLRMEEHDIDWDLWITTGEQPRPVKANVDLTRYLKAKGLEGKVKASNVVTFTNWRVGDAPMPEWFAFKAPEGHKLVTTFFEPKPIAGDDDAGHAKLVGKPAPEFELQSYKGEKIKLSSHKGKNVVVLDFWASWCGPCVAGLPHMTKTADQFKDKGVVFYGVNLREKPDVIEGFLEKSGLKFNILMDSDGAVSKLFGVSGIPQSVIIDKDGNIHDIHVGYAPGMEKELEAKLKKLTADTAPKG